MSSEAWLSKAPYAPTHLSPDTEKRRRQSGLKLSEVTISVKWSDKQRWSSYAKTCHCFFLCSVGTTWVAIESGQTLARAEVKNTHSFVRTTDGQVHPRWIQGQLIRQEREKERERERWLERVEKKGEEKFCRLLKFSLMVTVQGLTLMRYAASSLALPLKCVCSFPVATLNTLKGWEGYSSQH